MAKQKGARGEREAAALIEATVAPVFEAAGLPCPEITRNLMQSRQGGYDLVGLDWLALEVKRREQVQLSGWWRQTVRQAEDGQVPFLMWRQNRKPWQVRVRVPIAHRGRGEQWGLAHLDADLDLARAQDWLRAETWWRLTGSGW